MGGAEAYRAAGSAPGVDGLDKLYPGGPFDPLEFASDPVRSLFSSPISAHLLSFKTQCDWGPHSQRQACLCIPVLNVM
jgi:hypothetical protein